MLCYRHSKNNILQSISAGKKVFYWVKSTETKVIQATMKKE